MSDKIKKAYDDDPTAGNDPSADGYTAVGAGGSTAIGYSFDQVSNVVANRLNLAGNLPLQDSFSASIGNNTTIASIDAIVTSYTHYAITEDTTTAPTSGANSSIPGTYDTGVWTPTVLRLYISSDGSSFAEVLDNDGNSGINIVPNFTYFPRFLVKDFVLSAGTDTNAQVNYAFTLPVVPSPNPGGTITYDLMNRDDNTEFLIGITGGSGTISNLTPGQQIALWVRATANGNSSPSPETGDAYACNSDEITTTATATGGSVTLDATNFSVDEDSGPAVFTFTRTLTAGAVTFTVSTYNDTLTAGTANSFDTTTDVTGSTTDTIDITGHGWATATAVVYSNEVTKSPPVAGSATPGPTNATTYYITAVDADTIKLYDTAAHAVTNDGTGVVDLTSAGGETHWLFSGAFEPLTTETVNMANGVATATINVQVVTLAASSNSQFGLYIDDGSESATLVVGVTNSALMKVNSSLVSGTEFQEDGSADNVLCLYPASGTITAGEDASAAAIWDLRGADARTASDDAIQADWTNALGDAGTIADASPNIAPKVQWSVNLTLAAPTNYYVWTRVMQRNVSTANEFHMTYDDDAATPVVTLLDFNGGTTGGGINVYKWKGVDGSLNQQFFEVSSAGVHTLEIRGYEPNQIIDAVVVSTNSAYDPNIGTDSSEPLDDKLGPAESSVGGGTPEDNPGNAVSPISPPVAGTVTGTYTPLNGATGVNLQGDISIFFADATNLQLSKSFEVKKAGLEITGATAITQDGTGATATFNPTSILSENTEYTVDVTGTISDSSLVTKTFSTITDTFVFTTGTPSGDILNVDFESHALGTYDITQATADFNIGQLAYPETVGAVKQCAIVNDPLGIKGQVLECTHPSTEYNNGSDAVNIRIDLLGKDSSGVYNSKESIGGGGYDELFFAFDAMYEPTWEYVGWHKRPGLGTGTRLQMSHDTGTTPLPEGIEAFNALIQSYNAFSNGGDGITALNYYDADEVQKDNFWNSTTPSTGKTKTPVDEIYVFPRNQWVTIEMRVLMNDADDLEADGRPTTDSDNGKLQVWADGVLVVDVTHTWRFINKDGTGMKIDGVWFYDHFNSNWAISGARDLVNYYTNFRVSETRIYP